MGFLQSYTANLFIIFPSIVTGLREAKMQQGASINNGDHQWPHRRTTKPRQGAQQCRLERQQRQYQEGKQHRLPPAPAHQSRCHLPPATAHQGRGDMAPASSLPDPRARPNPSAKLLVRLFLLRAPKRENAFNVPFTALLKFSKLLV